MGWVRFTDIATCTRKTQIFTKDRGRDGRVPDFKSKNTIAGHFPISLRIITASRNIAREMFRAISLFRLYVKDKQSASRKEKGAEKPTPGLTLRSCSDTCLLLERLGLLFERLNFGLRSVLGLVHIACAHLVKYNELV